MFMENYYKELENKIEEYWSNKGKELGYSNEPCSNCGRVRVVMYQNGDGICEKCNWNRKTEEYEHPPID